MPDSYQTSCKIILFSLLVIQPLLLQFPLANEEPSLENKAEELESLKIHIKEAEEELNKANSEKLNLAEELKTNEIRISEVATKITQLKANLEHKQTKLQGLKQQEQKELQRLAQERKTLAQQIRSAYVVGRADYIKLLLNQEDPARISRVMAYYDYHNHSRSQLIETAIAKLQSLYDLEKSIELETAEIASLQSEHEQRLQDYANNREQRQAILLQLDQYINKKDEELESLHAAAKELGKLLKKLDENQDSTIAFFEDIPPFQTMRGKMAWPIKGQIIERFGSPKKGEDLRWNGVLIRAKTGTEVKAINNGKVIFADWFKNLGMLIILDHGNNYMSLYAHNESLLKKTNDWVLAGENIATVGDSGGQSTAGLYFEIRQQGKPVNPSLWCKN